MKRYKFTATLNQDDKRTGKKKGCVIKPKGFYYQKKKIILVGNVQTDDTMRMALPVESVDMEVTEYET